MGSRFRQLWELVTLYSLYVLFLLMLVYLVNQMDRFVLGIAAQQTAESLRYGEQSCLRTTLGQGGVKCWKIATRQNCTSSVHNSSCKWDYNGQGIEYQLLAGPTFVVVFSFAVIVMGFVAEVGRINRPKVLAIFVILWSVMTLLMGFARTYWQLALLRMGLGLFQSVCAPFGASIISDYFEKDVRGFAMAVFNWGVYVGFSLAFAFKYLALTDGWRWVFRVAGMPGIIVAIIIFFTVEDKNKKYHRHRPLKSRVAELCYVLRLFISPSLMLLCIAGGIRNGAGLAFAYNVDSFFTQYRHVNSGQYMCWVPLVGGTAGSVIGGILSDRVAKSHGHRGRLVVLVISQLVATPLAFGVLWISNPLGAFLCLLAAYVVGEMWIGVCLAVVVELRRKMATSAIAVYIFIINMVGGNMIVLVCTLSSQPGWNLQYALVVLFPGMYFLSAILFLLTLCVVQWNASRKREGKYQSDSGDFGESQDDETERPRVCCLELSTDINSADEQESLISDHGTN